MADDAITFAALLTTGPSPDEDAVVEVGAVRRGTDGAEEFALLADPGRLTRAFAGYSGLSQDDVKGCPAPEEALEGLREFCGDTSVVVHDAELLEGFFVAAGVKAPPCLDALELARVADPTANDYSLSGMAMELGMADAPAARAGDRARLIAAVWDALRQRLAELPGPALDLVCRLVTAAGHPLAKVINEAARGAGFDLAADPVGALRQLLPTNRDLLKKLREYEPPEPGDEPISTEGICAMFRPGAVVGQHLPGYEHRAEQVNMVEAVCEALNEPHHLMVEAGTGTSKCMAYLVPAIAWACTNEEKVIVSTNTRNLQEQLYNKDLPFLSRLLPGRFEPALLKGRRNYLCVRRFLHLVRHFEGELAEPREMVALAALVSWAVTTQAGDLAECNGFFLSPGGPGLVHAVVSGWDQCAGRACTSRGRCFLRRARARAQLADIIVVNHALLFSEIGAPSQVLPTYRCLIFDEAHNLEDVATRAFTVEVSALNFYRGTNLLYRKRQDGSGAGLLALVMQKADRGDLPEKTREALRKAAGQAMEAVDEVVEDCRQFFEMLGEPFEGAPPHVERLGLSVCQPDVAPGSDAWQSLERLCETIGSLAEHVEQMAETLETAEEERDTEELVYDLRSALSQLHEAADSAKFVLRQEEENFVYWLERAVRRRGTFFSIHAAPVQIGEYVRESFFAEKRCVIFTSATLQVSGDFDYMLERLGGDKLPPGRIRCLSAGSPFDYDSQALVGAATFLPDPGGRRDRAFDRELGEFLTDLLQATQGRALVLFTSYSLLEAVYAAVKQPLERAGIKVLAQGHSGSREAITAFFRSVPASVLLGTRSFWEGVDIAGETLSCLVLTKLPFHVFTDPLVRGRIAYLRTLGRDPFLHYTLPEAVISFRQGFGRLIRRRDDRGVVMVADRRIVTRDYGRSFLDSLPTRHQVLSNPEEALEAVRDFFGHAEPKPTG
ncbi:MAG: helicase C-terminal domain-containing protein [Candidatus Brocadiia bacterium]